MRIAILGFGFSGAMVAANLVRDAQGTLTLYIIDEHADARGVAYGATNPDHLLNVPAANMGAFAHDAQGFVAWLATDVAKQEAALLGVKTTYAPTDFVPRALYGAYLSSIWRQTQELAAQKNIAIKLVPTRAVAVQAGETPAVLTQRGDAIAVDSIVLAVGHEIKPIMPPIAGVPVIQNPWAHGALDEAKHWPSPVMLVGSGLTAVDMLLSLRRAGYAGDIIAASRNGKLPQPHAAATQIFRLTPDDIAAQRTLRQMVRFVRKTIAAQGDWRVVVDALRMHMQVAWQRLSTREQMRFLRWVLPVWGIYRHRMAPEIAARVAEELARGSLQVGRLRAMANATPPSQVLNCTGLELNLARSGNALLRQLLADGLVEPHATGLGVAADTRHRAWGGLYPRVYVVGSLLTGQLLESTAVPELRAQASAVASSIFAVG